MAYPFAGSSESFTQPHLIARLRRKFEDLPDTLPADITHGTIAPLNARYVRLEQAPAISGTHAERRKFNLFKAAAELL